MWRLVSAALGSLALHLGGLALLEPLFPMPRPVRVAERPIVAELRNQASPAIPALALSVPFPVQQIRNPAAFESRQAEKVVSSPTGDAQRVLEEGGAVVSSEESGEHGPAHASLRLPRYFSRNEVDRGPQIVGDLALNGDELNRELDGHFGHGQLVLVLWINDGGVVDKVEVQDEEMSDVLREIVVRHFSRALFVPARHEGVAVRSKIAIEVVVARPKPSEFPRFSNEYVGG